MELLQAIDIKFTHLVLNLQLLVFFQECLFCLRLLKAYIMFARDSRNMGIKDISGKYQITEIISPGALMKKHNGKKTSLEKLQAKKFLEFIAFEYFQLNSKMKFRKTPSKKIP